MSAEFGFDAADPAYRHHGVTPPKPAADGICLTLTQAPLKLTGRLGRLLNPFVRF